ncbi:hypothetical protein NDR87_28010 [Nocardia sp. CDC159]|uniref:Uncharacterized protein n=1 Tax=Nocardia pulmonis TaxID=2951408 RepID=A0A9X2IZB9_9NOCA|nr:MULTISPECIES: hypothetical protein [Nocardia]MCM6777338.1 hypothetical protein [Nocardia pulmonis]MCM6790223.1 hypothetical protein [Nocardia sp. CDC159]
MATGLIANYDALERRTVARLCLEIPGEGGGLDVWRRSLNVPTGIRIALAALPLAIALGYTTLAQAEPGPVQPGVTAPASPAPEEPAELRAATPQTPAAPPARQRPTTPQKTETPPPPPPHSIRVGDFEAPMPEQVPPEVVQGLQNAIDPGARDRPKP